jgi:ArsR family transcriptional regulator
MSSMAANFTTDQIELIADRFKALAEPMRLRILDALRDGEATVGEIVEHTGAGQANVSRHLNLLYRQGLVARRKDGLNVYYRIADPAIFRLCDLVCSSLEEQVDARRRKLRRR